MPPLVLRSKKSEPAIYCWWNCPQVRFKNIISEKNVSNSYADMPLKGHCPVKNIVRSKKVKFSILRCGKNVSTYLDKFFAQESDGVICFYVRNLKVTKKIVFEKVTS